MKVKQLSEQDPESFEASRCFSTERSVFCFMTWSFSPQGFRKLYSRIFSMLCTSVLPGRQWVLTCTDTQRQNMGGTRGSSICCSTWFSTLYLSFIAFLPTFSIKTCGFWGRVRPAKSSTTVGNSSFECCLMAFWFGFLFVSLGLWFVWIVWKGALPQKMAGLSTHPILCTPSGGFTVIA